MCGWFFRLYSLFLYSFIPSSKERTLERGFAIGRRRKRLLSDRILSFKFSFTIGHSEVILLQHRYNMEIYVHPDIEFAPVGLRNGSAANQQHETVVNKENGESIAPMTTIQRNHININHVTHHTFHIYTHFPFNTAEAPCALSVANEPPFPHGMAPKSQVLTRSILADVTHKYPADPTAFLVNVDDVKNSNAAGGVGGRRPLSHSSSSAKSIPPTSSTATAARLRRMR